MSDVDRSLPVVGDELAAFLRSCAGCPNCPCCWAFVCRDELWADWYGDQETPDPPCPCETAPIPPPQPTEAGGRFNRERNQALAAEARKD